MEFMTDLKQSKGTMKRKLFVYMLLLAAMVLTALILGLVIIGRIESPERDYYEKLDIQLRVFEKDMEAEFEQLTFKGISLSQKTTEQLEAYERKQDFSFDGTVQASEDIMAIQEQLVEPLYRQLLETDCSGAFIMLNTTACPKPSVQKENISEFSRSGIYLQKSNPSSQSFEHKVVLFRGSWQVGKQHGIMPHRKWKLEFESRLPFDYDRMVSQGRKPLHKAYYITKTFFIPGTSEKAVLLIVPMTGSNGKAYGVCGFELNESYFKAKHAQASQLSRLTCILADAQEKKPDMQVGLSSGVQKGYYMSPDKKLAYSKDSSGLIFFKGKENSYVGLMKDISLQPGNPDHCVAVMVPKEDYSKALAGNVIKTLLLLLLLAFAALCSCLYMSRRFLKPLLRNLEQLKKDEKADFDSEMREIRDLFEFLFQKDKKHEELLGVLEAEKKQAQEAFENAQREIDRLAYSRKKEVDPDDYQYFKEGLSLLTPMERRVFEYYLQGNTVKDIMKLAKIKESTLRYHNQNIYRKLGVNSLKQMLRYAAIWKNERREGEQ